MVVESAIEGTLSDVFIDGPVVMMSIERVVVHVAVGGMAANVTIEKPERERGRTR